MRSIAFEGKKFREFYAAVVKNIYVFVCDKRRERGEIFLSIIHRRVSQLPRNTQIDTFYRVIAKSFYIIALHAWGHIWLFRHHHTLETHKDMKSCLCLSATYNLCIGMNVVVGSSSRAEQTDKGLITCPQWQLLACQRRNHVFVSSQGVF